MNDKNYLSHVAIIMDGNGRWAKKHKLATIKGHTAGMDNMKQIIKESSNRGIDYLTVFAFSTENFKRSEAEVAGIFSLVTKYIDSEIDELDDNDVRVSVIGDLAGIPERAKNSLAYAIKRTQNNKGLRFCVAINYGAREELTSAFRKTALEILNQCNFCKDINTFVTEFKKKISAVTQSEIAKNLQSDFPDPDLLIRTSGEERISNFLLWQIAYSELVFVPELWPDFTKESYARCIDEFYKRNRRFGGR